MDMIRPGVERQQLPLPLNAAIADSIGNQSPHDGVEFDRSVLQLIRVVLAPNLVLG
jgi:hypothetical protein